MTYEAQRAIKSSDCVLYLLNEPAIKKWVEDNSNKAYSLDAIYFSNEKRKDSYSRIEKEVEFFLERYDHVCFVTYGNPVFFSSFTSNIVNSLKKKEINIEIMPAISALDCLYADLAIDPSEQGLQSFEATSFLLNDQNFSTDTPLVIWQVGVIGITDIIKQETDLRKRAKYIDLFIDKLTQSYSPSHECYHYVASQYPGVQSNVVKLTLNDLRLFDVDRLATLFIPAEKKKSINANILKLLKEN